jgi:hypothetical protein
MKANDSNSTGIPDWILERKAEDELAIARRDAESHRELAGAIAIAANGQALWSALTTELDRNARGLEHIGLNGRITMFPANNNAPEHHCRIDVSKPGPWPRFFHADLFYRPGGDTVRSLTADGKADVKQLTVNRDGSLSIMLDKYSQPLCANEAAARIAQDVIARVS